MAYVSYKMGGGLNLKASPDLIGDDELRVATGVNLFHDGQVRSEWGRNVNATFTTTGTDSGDWTNAMIGVSEVYQDGTRYLLCYSRGVWGYKPAASGSFTSLGYPSSSTAPGRSTALDYNGYVYIADGTHFRRWRLDEYVAAWEYNHHGTNYVIGDEVTASGGTGDPVVFEVDGIYDPTYDRVYSMLMVEPGDYSAFPSNPVTMTGGSGTLLTLDLTTAGNEVVRVGCPAPDTAAAVASEGFSGVSVAGQKYKWRYTFYNGVAESDFSPAMDTYTVSNSGRFMNVTIPVDSSTDTGTVARRIYRTDAGPGDAYFYVGEIGDNTSTTFSDPMGVPLAANATVSEGDAVTNRGGSSTEDVDLPPGAKGDRRSVQRPKCTPKLRSMGSCGRWDKKATNERADIIMTNLGFLADWAGHEQIDEGQLGAPRNLLLINDTVFCIYEEDTLTWFDIGNPEHYDPFRTIQIGRGYNLLSDSGERLWAIEEMEEDVVCYTNHGVWHFRMPGGDSDNASLEQIRDGIGTVSAAAVTSTESHGHIFAATDGLYQYFNGVIRRITDQIDDLWTDSTHPYYVDPDLLESCCISARDEVVHFSYRTTGDTFNTKTIRCDFRSGEPRWSTSPLGYQSFCVDTRRQWWAGGTGGNLYSFDGGISTSNVEWEVWTKQYPIRDTFMGEQAYAVTVDIDTNGTNVTAELYDQDDTILATWTLNTSARSKVRKLMPREGTHDRLSLRIYSSNTPAVRTLYGVAFETDEARLD